MSSLVDALLLDPWRDPREIWLARRADSQRGSGSISDPYDGGKREGAEFDLSLTKISDFAAQAMATGHGLLDWDVVCITGATDPAFNGEFWITVVDDDTFEYRTNAALQSSMESGNARKVIYLFDEVMRAAPANACVHLGPGVFETRGFVPRTQAQADSQGWPARLGQRITGAGMGATTLKLMHAASSTHLTLAIAHDKFSPPEIDRVDGFHASDFTVDCNMRSQPRDVVAKAAVEVSGRHIRLRRLRAVDFGTHITGLECFTLSTAGGHPSLPERVDCRIEDCVVERPDLNGLYTNTHLHLAAREAPDTGVMAFHRGCALRNNYANGEYQDAPVAIASITLSGAVATVTTPAAHGRVAGQWVVISGALVNGSLLNSYNGSYAITAIIGNEATSVQFEVTLSNWTGQGLPTSSPVGDMWVGRYSSRFLAIAEIEVVSPPSRIVRIKTAHPHNRTPSNYVNILGVQVGGFTDARFNGRFPVKEVLSPVELRFEINEEVQSQPTFTSPGLLGYVNQALSGEGGTAAVVEGNRVLHCWIGGPYRDTWASLDLETRNNYYHDVLAGAYQSINTGVSQQTQGRIILSSLSVDGTAATATTSKPHGLAAGVDKVVISESSINALNDPLGVLVTSVPNAKQFKISTTASEETGSPGYLFKDATFGTLRLVESLTRAAGQGGYLVTAKTSFAKHGFLKGDAVLIVKAGHFNLDDQEGFPHSTRYNGSYTIIDVPDEKTFCYWLPGDPNPGTDSGDAPDEFCSGYFGRIWQNRLSIYEGNWFDLGSRYGDESNPSAIGLSDNQGRMNPYGFGHLLARNNFVQSVKDSYGLVDDSKSNAVSFNSCEKALVDGNLIDVGYGEPINFDLSGAVQVFHNQTPAGGNLRGYNRGTQARIDDISTKIEDALTMSLL